MQKTIKITDGVFSIRLWQKMTSFPKTDLRDTWFSNVYKKKKAEAAWMLLNAVMRRLQIQCRSRRSFK